MKYSKEILEKLNSITDKRPATVIQHILKYGFITTEELENKYGYKHAPRAARDVRERGVNLVTYNVKSSEGKELVPTNSVIQFFPTIKYPRWQVELHFLKH